MRQIPVDDTSFGWRGCLDSRFYSRIFTLQSRKGYQMLSKLQSKLVENPRKFKISKIAGSQKWLKMQYLHQMERVIRFTRYKKFHAAMSEKSWRKVKLQSAKMVKNANSSDTCGRYFVWRVRRLRLVTFNLYASNTKYRRSTAKGPNIEENCIFSRTMKIAKFRFFPRNSQYYCDRRFKFSKRFLQFLGNFRSPPIYMPFCLLHGNFTDVYVILSSCSLPQRFSVWLSFTPVILQTQNNKEIFYGILGKFSSFWFSD